MSKFAYLKPLNATAETTAFYVIDRVTVNGRSPKLKLRPATQDNLGYFNKVLKKAAKLSRRVKNKSVDTDLIASEREDDKAIYASHVIVGWENVCDGEGKPVKFTAEDCKEFLDALPHVVFDDLRAFAGDITNFVDPIDIEQVAKN